MNACNVAPNGAASSRTNLLGLSHPFGLGVVDGEQDIECVAARSGTRSQNNLLASTFGRPGLRPFPAIGLRDPASPIDT
jgi:hypothetical protein